MKKLANFSSPPKVKAQLQAALYHARKNRLERIKQSEENEGAEDDSDS